MEHHIGELKEPCDTSRDYNQVTLESESDHLQDHLQEERHKVVKLQTVPEFLDGFTIPVVNEEPEITTIECRPFAILLRFRVAQIVCGIVTLLLGIVACLEPETRSSLSLGIPTGVLTALAAVAHIQWSRKEYSAGLLSSNPIIRMVSGITRRITHPLPFGALIAPFHPLMPTIACVLSAIVLFILASNSVTTGTDRNSHVLGLLQTIACFIVLTIEVTTWVMKWKWAQKQRNFRNENTNQHTL